MIQRSSAPRRKPGKRREMPDRRLSLAPVDINLREDGARRWSEERRGDLDRRLFI